MDYLSAHKRIVLLFILILCAIPLFVYLAFIPKPGSCLILEEKFCKTGIILKYNNKIAGLGFYLPKNTTIFSPFDGRFDHSTIGLKKDNEIYSYLGVSIGSGVKGDHVWDIEQSFNAYYFENQNTIIKDQVKKGQVLGKISSKNIDYFGSYNLFIYFAKPDKERFIAIDPEYTLKLFGL